MPTDPDDPTQPAVPQSGPDPAPVFEEPPAEPPEVIDEPQRNTEF